MPCPECQDHATPEQVAELLAAHHAQLQAAFDAQLKAAIAEVIAQATTTRAAHEPLH